MLNHAALRDIAGHKHLEQHGYTVSAFDASEASRGLASTHWLWTIVARHRPHLVHGAVEEARCRVQRRFECTCSFSALVYTRLDASGRRH